MLLTDDSKSKFSAYLADLILNFICLCRERGVMDLINRCLEDKNSKEFFQLRDILIQSFKQNFDDKEMEMVFKEIEILFKELSSHKKQNS